MGVKLIQNMYAKPDHKQVKFLKNKYLHSHQRESILTIQNPPKGSVIWNFLLSCACHLEIRLQGQSRFLDSWKGHKVLMEDQNAKEVKQILIDRWGGKVCNWVEKVWEHGSEKWKWRDMQGLLNDQYAASLRCILMGRQVIITSEDV